MPDGGGESVMRMSSMTESVWDYPRPPRVEPSTRVVRVVLGGGVIAESARAHRVLETSHPPVYYVPLEDVAPGALEPAAGRTTFCEWKGTASYFDATGGDGAASSARRGRTASPLPGFEAIRDAVAFYPAAMDECTLDGELVQRPGGRLLRRLDHERDRRAVQGRNGDDRLVKRPALYVLSDWTRFRSWYSWLYRVEVTGRELVPADGPAILVANHESMIDPWLLGLVTPRPVRFMAKAELWKYAPTRWFMEAFGTFPVSRGIGDREAVGRGAELLAQGAVLGIFPQGTCLPYRHRPWMRGAARLAQSTGTPLIPVLLVGSEKALRPGKFKVGLPRIRVIVCPPIEVEQARPTVASSKALTAQIEAAIEAAREPFGPPAHAWYPEEEVA